MARLLRVALPEYLTQHLVHLYACKAAFVFLEVKQEPVFKSLVAVGYVEILFLSQDYRIIERLVWIVILVEYHPVLVIRASSLSKVVSDAYCLFHE